jgi:hypothetical protein
LVFNLESSENDEKTSKFSDLPRNTSIFSPKEEK